MNKTSQKSFWKDWFTNRKRKLDIKALLVCILIAFTLWLIGALSNESSLDLHFTLQPIQLDEACEIDQINDLELNVTVQSKGFDLLNRWFQSTNTPIELPLSKFPCKSGKISISSSQLKTLVLPHLNDGLSITKMTPDELEISLVKKAVKKLPVEADVFVSSPPGFRFNNRFIISPDSIPIEGSSEVINEINTIKTTNYQAVTTDLILLDLIIPNGLSSTVASVSVLPTFDTLLSRWVTLTPSIDLNVPQENITLFPPTVDVEIIGTAHDIQSIHLDNLKLLSRLDSM
ncbi:MAG: hypothetical protein ACPGWM_08045, partial [Flavobacteriales bacterium]